MGRHPKLAAWMGGLLEEADTYLNKHPDLSRLTITKGGYRHYKFSDKSEIVIRPDGEIIRTPHAMYESDGTRIVGYHINIYTGKIMRANAWHKLPRSEQEWVVF